MSVEPGHTIVPCCDKQGSAAFLAGIPGPGTGPPLTRFVPVTLDTHATLDLLDVATPQPEHCAFVVDDGPFAATLAHIIAAEIGYHAEPGGDRPGKTYRRWGGRGVSLPDPDGHSMELLTPTAPVPAP